MSLQVYTPWWLTARFWHAIGPGLDRVTASGGSLTDVPQRRPYPKVEPKYRNPNNPTETWSGRGKTPRWLSKLIGAGKKLDDFSI
jgi:DNA-binding protein H-NS